MNLKQYTLLYFFIRMNTHLDHIFSYLYYFYLSRDEILLYIDTIP